MNEIEELKRRISHLENQVNLLTELYLDLKSDQWINSQECCERLKISRSTLDRYRKQAKEGVHYKIHGERGYRYHAENFRKLIQGES